MLTGPSRGSSDRRNYACRLRSSFSHHPAAILSHQGTRKWGLSSLHHRAQFPASREEASELSARDIAAVFNSTLCALCQAAVYQRSLKSLTVDLVPSPPLAGDPGQVSAELLTHGDEDTDGASVGGNTQLWSRRGEEENTV